MNFLRFLHEILVVVKSQIFMIEISLDWDDDALAGSEIVGYIIHELGLTCSCSTAAVGTKTELLAQL